ncbi:MAG: hypothetical protein ACUVSQ_02195 [Pseudanabaenaceae cyanobacterium]
MMHTDLQGTWRRSPLWFAAFGLWSLLTGNVNAQTASFSAAAAYTTIVGTSSVNAEITLPVNMFFNGNPSFTASYSGTGINRVVDGLTLSPGTPTVVPVGATFSRTAAAALQQTATGSFTGDLEATAALIRAGAGTDGLD